MGWLASCSCYGEGIGDQFKRLASVLVCVGEGDGRTQWGAKIRTEDRSNGRDVLGAPLGK